MPPCHAGDQAPELSPFVFSNRAKGVWIARSTDAIGKRRDRSIKYRREALARLDALKAPAPPASTASRELPP